MQLFWEAFPAEVRGLGHRMRLCWRPFPVMRMDRWTLPSFKLPFWEAFPVKPNLDVSMMILCVPRSYFYLVPKHTPMCLFVSPRTSAHDCHVLQGGRSRTTYMFAYSDAEPERPSIEQLLDTYFEQMPQYQVGMALGIHGWLMGRLAHFPFTLIGHLLN